MTKRVPSVGNLNCFFAAIIDTDPAASEMEKSLTDLKSMSVAQLLALRDDVAKYLTSKRAELENMIRQLGGSEKAASSSNGRRGEARGKVAAKYRHPTTGETWSGRGGTVRWLAEELKAGKKKEDFLISNASKKPAAKKSAKKAKKSRSK